MHELTQREGQRRSLNLDDKSKLRGRAGADLRAAKTILKQLERDGEAVDKAEKAAIIPDIDERRARAVPKRRDALAKAVEADKRNAADPSLW